jgi:superfamily II DNA or RNA helicase
MQVLKPIVLPPYEGPPPALELGNVLTRVSGLTWESKTYLESLTSVPTPTAGMQEGGWSPPEASVGETFWNGYERLCRFPSPGLGVLPTGLVPLVQTRMHARVTADYRKRPEHGVPERGAIPLRDYQGKATEEAWKVGYGVFDMVPRAGKTRTLLEVLRGIALPAVWIAPTTNIVSQTVAAAVEFFGKNWMVPVVGVGQAMAATSAPVVICTAATAAALPQAFFDSRMVLVMDEIHHCAARSWRAITSKTHHIFYRFGMSGTFMRSGEDELAMHSVLSNVLCKVTAEELVKLGFLVAADVVFLVVKGQRLSVPAGRTFQAGAGKLGIYEHSYRNNLAVWSAATLWSRKKQPLVLVGTKAQGNEINDRLQNWLPASGQYPGSAFVSTNRTADWCGDTIRAFVEKKFPVLVGTSMVGEGTDLPSADALVYAIGSKAEVPHTQAAYRVATAVPGKSRAVIVDFADQHHDTLSRHSSERLETYFNQPIFKVSVLNDPAQFPGWLDSLK